MQRSIKLWRDGRAGWNKWVKEHPNGSVNFTDVKFAEHKDTKPKIQEGLGDAEQSDIENENDDEKISHGLREKNKVICLKGYNFPSGGAVFERSDFRGFKVDFKGAQFFDEGPDFTRAKFSSGRVTFASATFWNCGIESHAQFFYDEENFYGIDWVYFSNGAFNEHKSKTPKKNASVSSFKTDFGNDNVIFQASKFTNCKLSFFQARFGQGRITFSAINHGKNDFNFERVKFGSGNFISSLMHPEYVGVDFHGSTFSTGETSLSLDKSDEIDFIFDYSTFPGPLKIEMINSREPGSLKFRKLINLSFRACTFMRPILLSGNVIDVPDFRSTRMQGHIDLSDLNIQCHDVQFWQKFKKAIHGFIRFRFLENPRQSRCEAHFKQAICRRRLRDPTEAPKLRRLKELAEQNRDHDAALRFFAMEQRDKRWSMEYSDWQSCLDVLYDAACNYGQSILRPTIGLLTVYFAAAILYARLATKTANPIEAMILAATNSLPLLAFASDARAGALSILFGDHTPWYNDLIAGLQGVASFIFLFLIGLGLRNRFRIQPAGSAGKLRRAPWAAPQRPSSVSMAWNNRSISSRSLNR